MSLTPPDCRKQMLEAPPSITIASDASNLGWGAVGNGQHAGGPWTAAEKEHHINWKELAAVFLGLKALVRDTSSCTIWLEVDNTTAVAYLNHPGGTHSRVLCDLAIQVWQWAAARQLNLIACSPCGMYQQLNSGLLVTECGGQWRLAAAAHDILASATSVRSIFPGPICSPQQPPTSSVLQLATRSWCRGCGRIVGPTTDVGAGVPLSTIPTRGSMPTFHQATSCSSGHSDCTSVAVSNAFYPSLQRMLVQPPDLLPVLRDIVMSPEGIEHPLWEHLALAV